MVEEIIIANLNKSQRWSNLCKSEIVSLLSGFRVISGLYNEDDAVSTMFYIIPIMASTLVTPNDLINETKNLCSAVDKSETGYSIVIAVVEVDSSITYLKIKEGINMTI